MIEGEREGVKGHTVREGERGGGVKGHTVREGESERGKGTHSERRDKNIERGNRDTQ